MHRSPAPTFTSTKDTRNHPLWQPSLSSLRNVEQDEAGRLRAFRTRFGRGWDLDSDISSDPKSAPTSKEAQGGETPQGGKQGYGGSEGGEGSLMDLIGGGYTDSPKGVESAGAKAAREAAIWETKTKEGANDKGKK